VKKCPYCAEEIQDLAVVCKHCGRDIKGSGDTASRAQPVKVELVQPKRKRWGCASIGCLVLLALVGVLFVRVSTKEEKTHSSTERSLLKAQGQQGVSFFVLAPGSLIVDPGRLEQQSRQFCDENGGSICQVFVWTNPQLVAGGFPLSDKELRSQVAQYERNKHTGHDCFFLMMGGKMLEASRRGRCD